MEAALTEAKKLKDEDEERRRQDLSEQEKLKEDLAKAEAAQLAAEEERDYASFQAHVGKLGAKLGIKNLEYAEHLVSVKADALPEGEQLDAEAYLTELTAEGSEHRAPLGVAAPVVTETTPVTTTTDPNAPPPAAPAPGGGTGDPADANSLDAEGWAKRKAALGIQ